MVIYIIFCIFALDEKVITVMVKKVNFVSWE